MIVGALVLPRTTTGITEASTTRSPSTPSTRSVAVGGRHAQVAAPHRGQRRLRGDLQQHPHRPDGGGPVLLGGEVAVHDVRLGRRQQRAQEHLAAAAGAQQAGAEHVGVPGRQGQALVDEHHRGSVDLEVRPGQAVSRPEEPARLADVGGQRATALGLQQRHVRLGLGADQRLDIGHIARLRVGE
jgi:hypothetical protein